MNVEQLKEYIKDLPDDMPIMIAKNEPFPCGAGCCGTHDVPYPADFRVKEEWMGRYKPPIRYLIFEEE